MKYTCKICGKEYEYCHSCSLTKDVFKNVGYCGENCYKISMLIQSYRSNVTSAEDAAKALKECGANSMNIVPSVKVYVDEINGKCMPKVEAPIVEEQNQNIYYNKRKNKVKESLPIEENTSSLINEDTKLLDE